MSDSGQSGEHRGQERQGRVIGRYEMFEPIASTAFAVTHIGRIVSADGVAKPVAIQRLHGQFAKKPDLVRTFLAEARRLANVQHPNVVPALEFIDDGGEPFIVMDYVEGVSLEQVLTKLRARDQRLPLDITLQIMAGALRGLHAAHQARDDRGKVAGVFHGDVAPDNILVGVDGHARVLSFGVAKAHERHKASREGRLAYLTPEQVRAEPVTAATDVFALSTLFWECLTNRRLFDADNLSELALKVSQQSIVAPSVYYPTLPRKYEDIVLRGLEREPNKRWPSAEQMADALEAAGKLASAGRVGKWLKGLVSDQLERRAQMVSMVELTPAGTGAATQASGGQNQYRAVATQVLKRKRILEDEEATNVIDPEELRRKGKRAPAATPEPVAEIPPPRAPAVTVPASPQAAATAPAPQPIAVPPPSTPPRSRRRVPRKPVITPPDPDATLPMISPVSEEEAAGVTAKSAARAPAAAASDPDGTLQMRPSFDAPPADDEVTAPNYEPPARPAAATRKKARAIPPPPGSPPAPSPALPKPTAAKPTAAKPALAKPALAKPALAKPALAKPLAKPDAAKPAAAKPRVSEPPAPDEPVAAKARAPQEPVSVPGVAPSSEALAVGEPPRSGRGRTVGVFMALAATAALAALFMTRSETAPNAGGVLPAAPPAAPSAQPEPAPASSANEAFEPPEAPIAESAEPTAVASAPPAPAPTPAPVAARPSPRPAPAARPAPRPVVRPVAPKPAPAPREDKLFSRE